MHKLNRELFEELFYIVVGQSIPDECIVYKDWGVFLHDEVLGGMFEKLWDLLIEHELIEEE